MQSKRRRATAPPESHWASVLARTAGDVGASADLLGDFLPDLDAAASGTPLDLPHVDGYRSLGRLAAQRGVPVRTVVDLYLTASRTAWADLTAVRDQRDVQALRETAATVLGAVDDVVAAVCEGYEDARRTAARAEEALRREFVDDLLSGTSRLAQLVERASAFGLRLEAQHFVLVVSGGRPFLDHRVMVRDVEAALLARAGGKMSDANLLVATRGGLLVAVVPPELHDAAGVTAGQLERERALTWRLSVSRTRAGAAGVRMGFEEARAALELADRMAVPDRIVRAEDMLIFQVLTRDREMAAELVETVLQPLTAARGGAAPLLETLRVYFACNNTAVHAAEQLHLSVRAVTYRLDRVKALTGRDPGDPGDRFILDAALRSAAALGWPAVPPRP